MRETTRNTMAMEDNPIARQAGQAGHGTQVAGAGAGASTYGGDNPDYSTQGSGSGAGAGADAGAGAGADPRYSGYNAPSSQNTDSATYAVGASIYGGDNPDYGTQAAVYGRDDPNTGFVPPGGGGHAYGAKAETVYSTYAGSTPAPPISTV
jgi:hypothetical protein